MYLLEKLGESSTALARKSSLVPRPFPAPVFDRLQYAKTEPETEEVEQP